MCHRTVSCMQWEDGNKPSKWVFQAVAKAVDVDERALFAHELKAPCTSACSISRSLPGATETVLHIPPNMPQREDCLGMRSLGTAKERSFLTWRQGDARLIVLA